MVRRGFPPGSGGRLRLVSSPPGPAVVVPLRRRRIDRLLVRSAASDTASFADLYDATSADVYGLALRVLGSAAEAEDVAREAYVELWRTAPLFDPGRSTGLGWVLGITLRRTAARLGASGDGLGPACWPTHGRATDPIGEAVAMLGAAQRLALVGACDRADQRASTPLTDILRTLATARWGESLRRDPPR